MRHADHFLRLRDSLEAQRGIIATLRTHRFPHIVGLTMLAACFCSALQQSRAHNANALTTRTPNIKCAITLTGPRTRTVRAPYWSLRRLLTRSEAVRSRKRRRCAGSNSTGAARCGCGSISGTWPKARENSRIAGASYAQSIRSYSEQTRCAVICASGMATCESCTLALLKSALTGMSPSITSKCSL